MPVSCCSVGCTSRFSVGSGIGFFVFPVDKARKDKWVRAVSRQNWQPTASTRICGEHFVSGKPSRDPNSVDYVPTLFKDGKKRLKVTASKGRSERRSCREKVKEDKTLEESKDIATIEEAAGVLVNMSQARVEDLCPTRVTSHACVQTVLTSEALMQEMIEARTRIQELSTQVHSLENKMQSMSKSQMDLIKWNDEKTRFYTGLPSYDMFKWLCEYFESISSVPGVGRSQKLSLEEQILSVLIRLRLGLLMEDVADRFDISLSSYSKIFTSWIKTLRIHLKNIFPWPSKHLITKYTPLSFKKYPNTRIIIDCTEFFIQRPSSLMGQSITFSHYKHHNTFKLLVGISPGGVATFISELWGGRISDKALTEKSGLLDLLEPGDNVMADRGFDIHSTLSSRGITLNIPPFLGSRQQLTSQEVLKTRHIASLRIHVERAIDRIKNFRLLQHVLPLKQIFVTKLPHVFNIRIPCYSFLLSTPLQLR
jgi:hypothetical protein